MWERHTTVSTHLPYRPSALLALAVTLTIGLGLAGCASSHTPTAARPSGAASPSALASATIRPSAAPTPSAAPSANALPSASPGGNGDEVGFACDEQPVTSPGTTPLAQIVDVRIGKHDGFDRIVFEFTGGIPQFSVTPMSPPFHQDGSGNPLTVNGDAFVQILMIGGTKLSQVGGLTYTGPRDFKPAEFEALVHLTEGGDFEAVSTWYAGMRGDACFRVLTLSAPARLVIDLEHQ